MNTFNSSIEAVIAGFQCLPGVGRKTATRMTLYLLQGNLDEAEQISKALQQAVEAITVCEQCRNLSDQPICQLCASSKRSDDMICVVETCADLVAIEEAGGYFGRYFVLHGLLSPIDGIGPHELGLHSFKELCRSRGVKEVVLATNPTIEGEATAQYVSELVSDRSLTVSRIAHGIPIGGELGYTNARTIAHALQGRTKVEIDAKAD